jgi:hypothetical protein
MSESDENLRKIAMYEHEFDQGLRQCLTLCDELQEDLWRHFGSLLASDDGVNTKKLMALLLPWSRRFYEIVGHTLFKVLAIMQPDDFARGPVNFYLWPTYHSHLVKRRLHYQPNGDGEYIRRSTFGLGLCGNPAEEVQAYHNCCQATWYERATTRASGDLSPASPYHWCMQQQPRLAGGKHLMSVTFTTAQSGELGFAEHQRRYVPPCPVDSRQWGHKLAELLNATERERPTWTFPDRWDVRDHDPAREVELRELRCMLLSLWMHSVFCAEKPAWWNDLMQEASRHSSGPLLGRLSDGLLDDVAMDWADASTGRPRFVTWNTLVIEPLVSPPPRVAAGPSKRVPERPEAYDEGRNVGWAMFLCSVPLSQAFIMTARRWLRTMYAAMRNTEISALLKGRDTVVETGTSMGFLAHDFRGRLSHLANEIQVQAAETSRDAIWFRIFAMRTLQGMADLLCDTSLAARNPAKLAQLRKDFYQALALPAEQVRGFLILAAWDVIKSEGAQCGGRVQLPECPSRTELLAHGTSITTYTYCLLLVSEMLRNYVRHSPADKVATWSVDVDAHRLLIRLEGPVDYRPYVSGTFDALHTFLATVCGGRAENTCRDRLAVWLVEVPLNFLTEAQ